MPEDEQNILRALSRCCRLPNLPSSPQSFAAPGVRQSFIPTPTPRAGTPRKLQSHLISLFQTHPHPPEAQQPQEFSQVVPDPLIQDVLGLGSSSCLDQEEFSTKHHGLKSGWKIPTRSSSPKDSVPSIHFALQK